MADTNLNENGYLKQLDGLRFIAVGMVLIDHWLADDSPLPFGPLGVNLFFVLSGFLITRILLTSKEKNRNKTGGLGYYLKKFYIRRTLRIFPIYYISVCVLWLMNNPSVVNKLSWHLLYATNIYIAHYETWFGVTDHFWSLAVEEQFYIFFPIILFFLPRKFVIPFLIGTIVLSFGLRIYYFQTTTHWTVSYVSMLSCLDAFGLGGLMAYLFLYQFETFKKIFSNHIFLIISILFLGLQLWYEKQFSAQRNFANDVTERLISSICFFFLIGGAILGYKGWFKWLLENPVSNYLGRISYGLYIYHNFIYNFYHTPDTHPIKKMFVKFPITYENNFLKLSILFCILVVVASFSWYIVEKPINALKDKLTH